jgi:F0F1-type ATP synthase epsilon subunit
MGSPKPLLNVKILAEKGTLFEGLCECLLLPYEKEEIAILPQHTPIIALLTSGPVKIMEQGKQREITTIKSGILYVGEDKATVLVNA